MIELFSDFASACDDWKPPTAPMGSWKALGMATREHAKTREAAKSQSFTFVRFTSPPRSGAGGLPLSLPTQVDKCLRGPGPPTRVRRVAACPAASKSLLYMLTNRPNHGKVACSAYIFSFGAIRGHWEVGGETARARRTRAPAACEARACETEAG